jgi:hypothetical protein
MLHPKLSMMTSLCAAVSVALLAGCGGDETQPSDDHTPASYSISVNGTAVSAPYTFSAGEQVLVRIQFLNAAGENLDDVESSHFAGLTFQPTSLATAVLRADHHFQFDVTGNAEGSGTLTVRFGHSAAADEKSFPAAAATVSGSPPNPL